MVSSICCILSPQASTQTQPWWVFLTHTPPPPFHFCTSISILKRRLLYFFSELTQPIRKYYYVCFYETTISFVLFNGGINDSVNVI